MIEAAERVVQDVGWSGAKVARIAKVAGVSVGSLYRYFPGRDVLLRALIDRRLDGDRAAFTDALKRIGGPTLRDSLHAFGGALLADVRLTSPMLLRQLVDLLDAAGRLDTVHTMFDAMARDFSVRIVAQHPELGELAWVERRAHMLFWGLRGAFVARVRVKDPFDMEAFLDDAMSIAEATLTPRAPTPPRR